MSIWQDLSLGLCELLIYALYWLQVGFGVEDEYFWTLERKCVVSDHIHVGGMEHGQLDGQMRTLDSWNAEDSREKDGEFIIFLSTLNPISSLFWSVHSPPSSRAPQQDLTSVDPCSELLHTLYQFLYPPNLAHVPISPLTSTMHRWILVSRLASGGPQTKIQGYFAFFGFYKTCIIVAFIEGSHVTKL